jgi:general secretion pathway protein C
MLTLQPKQVKIFLLISICACGLSAGYFTAQLAGTLIQPPTGSIADGTIDKGASIRPAKVNTGLILRNNIFDPAARGKTSTVQTTERAAPVTTAASSNLKLFGTVDGGKSPMALIKSGGKVKIYKVGAELPDGSELLSVSRKEAVIRLPGGTQEILTISKPAAGTTSAPPAASTSTGIRALGENRWSVSRTEVDKARSNLNQLLKSARMEPNIVNGQTEGFVVKMLRPKSLLAQLGIRRGDTVTRVNGVELNSPEKALQIFQQLREAKRLTVDLKRGSENLSFDYEVN